MGCIFMAKYSEQFKLMVVREYQEGKLGYDLLAKKHGIKSSTTIKKWVGIPESSYHYQIKMMKKNENPDLELEESIQSIYE